MIAKASLLITLIVFVPIYNPARHEFHVSVTEIVYKQEAKALHITMRLFMDDFQEELRLFTGNNGLDIEKPKTPEVLKALIGKYLTQKFKLSTKSYLPIQYYGFEYDEDLIWAYMEAQKVRKFKAITIENNLLLDTFQNQENIVHMRGLGRTRSWRFNHNRTTIKYDLEDR